MSKLLGLAFADLHLHPFQAFAKHKYDRLHISFDVWRFIFTQALEKGVPVFFAGDLVHNHRDIENYILHLIINFFKGTHEKNRVPFICISGNHDMCEKNTEDNQSPSYIQTLANIFEFCKCIDRDHILVGNFERETRAFIWGVPYMNDEKALIKMIKEFNEEAGKKKATKILLLHTDLPNCPTPTGHVVKEVEGIPNSDKLWKNFDHVLSGHIHRPTEMTKRAAMLGSPIHQDEGDEGCIMGYWEIYDDKKVFKPLTAHFPSFVRVDPWDEIAIDQLNAEGQYVLFNEEPEKEEDIEAGRFTTRIPVKKLVSRYLKAKDSFTPERKRLLTELLIEAKNI